MKPEELLFSKTHEWVHIGRDGEETVATVGISAFALEQLTDLVYIALPQAGRSVKAGDSIGEIESVKAVSDLYSPVTGTIREVNTALADSLETFSNDPYGAGWVVKIEVTDESHLDQLMDYAAYERQCAEEA